VRRSVPKITITCDCGAQRKVDYGESYVCECGRAWSTKQIPEADYAAIRALDRSYRRKGWIGFGGFLVLCLAVAFFGDPVTLLFLIPAGLMLWFSILRPMVRRRHWRAIQALTRRWTLRAE
jgi:hypothetical protein